MGTTNQELTVLRIVKRHKHINAEQVFKIARKRLPRISKSTVYNNLEKLFLNKKINMFEALGKRYYCCNSNTHFVCIKCGRIIDRKKEIKIKTKHFKTTNTNIVSYGYCEKCIRLNSS